MSFPVVVLIKDGECLVVEVVMQQLAINNKKLSSLLSATREPNGRKKFTKNAFHHRKLVL